MILLKSRDETLAFLATRPNPDEDIPWCCSNSSCLATNKNNVYHSRQARCSSCGKGRFPAVHLPITGNPSSTLQKIFIEEQLKTIKDQIKEQEKEIENHEEEIRDCQCYINTLTEEKKDLEGTLSKLMQDWCGE